jgi:hypothetical protein
MLSKKLFETGVNTMSTGGQLAPPWLLLYYERT